MTGESPWTKPLCALLSLSLLVISWFRIITPNMWLSSQAIPAGFGIPLHRRTQTNTLLKQWGNGEECPPFLNNRKYGKRNGAMETAWGVMSFQCRVVSFSFISFSLMLIWFKWSTKNVGILFLKWSEVGGCIWTIVMPLKIIFGSSSITKSKQVYKSGLK